MNSNSIFKIEPIRIPVKLVDGQWEFFYGGPLPIRDGAVGDLVVDKYTITDKEFLARLKMNVEHKILGVGTELRVALTIKPDPSVDAKLKEYLIPMNAKELGDNFFHTSRSPDTQFVNVCIGKPTSRQEKINPAETGGVWLQLQGTQPKGISTSRVVVPVEVSKEPLESLNHAFTRLSEVYEPWRKSHTGNIYDRVLYKECNGRWYPLNILRNAAIAKDEHELIRKMWAELSQKLNKKVKAHGVSLSK